MSKRHAFFFVTLTALALTGCALEPATATVLPEAPPSTGKADVALVNDASASAGVIVFDRITGTPTYGTPATERFFLLSASIDDDLIRAHYPDFDGLESVFALVPRRTSVGSVQWEGIRLSYESSTPYGHEGDLYGYLGDAGSIDDHTSEELGGLDEATVRELGVAFGMNTNVGVIWLQEAGDNWRVQD